MRLNTSYNDEKMIFLSSAKCAVIYWVLLNGLLITMLMVSFLFRKKGFLPVKLQRIIIYLISTICIVYVYWILFIPYFYGFNIIGNKNKIELIYMFPERKVILNVHDIDKVVIKKDRYKGDLIEINLYNGKKYISAPPGYPEINQAIDKLKK